MNVCPKQSRAVPAWLVAAALAAAPCAALAVGPDAVTLQRLEAVLKSSSAKKAGQAMTVRSHAIVSKPDGSDKEDVVQETVVAADGTSVTRVISATRGGRDVTAEEQARLDKGEAERGRAAAGQSADSRHSGTAKEPGKVEVGLKVPVGEDRSLFSFGAARSEGGLLVASFEPVPGAQGDDLSRGRLAWKVDGGDPAWLETSYAERPTGLKEFLMRMEFARAGDTLYMRTLRMTGVGGILWIKRKFDVTVEMIPGAAAPAVATPATSVAGDGSH